MNTVQPQNVNGLTGQFRRNPLQWSYNLIEQYNNKASCFSSYFTRVEYSIGNSKNSDPISKTICRIQEKSKLKKKHLHKILTSLLTKKKYYIQSMSNPIYMQIRFFKMLLIVIFMLELCTNICWSFTKLQEWILHSTTVESTRPKLPTNVPVRVQTETLKQPAKISSEYYTKSVDERKKHELTRESRLRHNWKCDK